MLVLPDGTRVGFRRSRDWGGSVDVWYPNGYDDVKTHTPYEPYFPPLVSGPPQLPPAAGIPSVQVIPQQLTHPTTALPRAEIFEPNGLPPWLQNPSAPGLHTPVQSPTIMPGVTLPEVAHTSEPAPDSGSELTVMGGAVVDASQAVGSAIVGSIAAIGSILGTVATPAREVIG